MPSAAAHRHRPPWVTLVWAGALLAVVLYNSWRLCCGQCTLLDLTVIPWSGWLLIAINLLALAVLWVLQHRNRRAVPTGCCNQCLARLHRQWSYCPNCGQDQPHTSS